MLQDSKSRLSAAHSSFQGRHLYRRRLHISRVVRLHDLQHQWKQREIALLDAGGVRATSSAAASLDGSAGAELSSSS